MPTCEICKQRFKPTDLEDDICNDCHVYLKWKEYTD